MPTRFGGRVTANSSGSRRSLRFASLGRMHSGALHTGVLIATFVARFARALRRSSMSAASWPETKAAAWGRETVIQPRAPPDCHRSGAPALRPETRRLSARVVVSGS